MKYKMYYSVRYSTIQSNTMYTYIVCTMSREREKYIYIYKRKMYDKTIFVMYSNIFALYFILYIYAYYKHHVYVHIVFRIYVYHIIDVRYINI